MSSDPHALTLAQRCKLATDCLPQADYRTRLEALHAEMLHALAAIDDAGAIKRTLGDPHDREPIDQATIDCWRATYGLDKRTPRDAAMWWVDNCAGRAPPGAVAALGVALEELDTLRTALEHVVRVMGPKTPPCCAGCETEWTEALRTAREAVGAA